MTESEFIAKEKNVSNNRHHKLSNSYTIRDYYRYFRRFNKNLTETQFSLILKEILKECGNLLLQSKDVYFPQRMGSLQVRKFKKNVRVVDGKLKINLPVDWNETLKLWYSDESSKRKKKLIRCDNPWIFRIFYSRKNSNYNNKTFFTFRANRNLKMALKEEIRNNNFDCFELWRQMEQQ